VTVLHEHNFIQLKFGLRRDSYKHLPSIAEEKNFFTYGPLEQYLRYQDVFVGKFNSE